MLEIKEVRDNFIKTSTELRAIAYGYLRASDDRFMKHVNDETEKMIEVIEATNAGKNQALQEQFATWRNANKSYLDNRNMPLELFHAYFIQAWQSFLDNIFEVIIKEHFSGLKLYEIKPIPIEFRSSEDTPNNLVDNIRQRVEEYFNNKMSSDDKLAIVTKAQNVTLPEALKKNIRKHVLVRNIFQHSQGKLRTRDLKHLQSDNFKYPCIEGEEQGDYYNPEQIRD